MTQTSKQPPGSQSEARPDDIEHLLENNRQWAAGIERAKPGFFSQLATQQNPRYLWIGCADSRVPANEILGLLPGEVFVHRNVANVVVHSDLNCLSVIQYAVDVLKIEHIIVCGHHGCGGVVAALQGQKLGLIDNWLRHVQDVYKRNQAAVDAQPEGMLRINHLCELHVEEQALNVAETTLVQDAWARGQQLAVHAMVYDLSDGILRRLSPSIHSLEALQLHRDNLGRR